MRFPAWLGAVSPAAPVQTCQQWAQTCRGYTKRLAKDGQASHLLTAIGSDAGVVGDAEGPLLPRPLCEASSKWKGSTVLPKALMVGAQHREVWECSHSHATAGSTVGVNCRCSAQGLCANPSASLLAGSYGMDPSLNRASHVLEAWLHHPCEHHLGMPPS